MQPDRNALTPLFFAALVTAGSACSRDARPAQTPPPPLPQQDPHAMHAMHGTHHKPAPPTGHAAGQAHAVDPGAGNVSRPVTNAIAMLHTTGNDRKPAGTVRFIDRGDDGVDLEASVENLPRGVHAYHVHVYGDCSSPDAKSAGPHFHFTGSSFDKEVKIITGNLGDLTIDGSGRATHTTRLHDARMHGPYSIIGRAVVIHAKPNDPSITPDGGAGDRIACGVIGVAESPDAAQSANR